MILHKPSHNKQNGPKIKYYLEPFCGLREPYNNLVRERGVRLKPPPCGARKIAEQARLFCCAPRLPNLRFSPFSPTIVKTRPRVGFLLWCAREEANLHTVAGTRT